MKTENLLNFEFADGSVSMHVRATKYFTGSGIQYRVSYSNSMRDESYQVLGYGPFEEDLMTKKAKELRASCYADMASFLQQVM